MVPGQNGARQLHMQLAVDPNLHDWYVVPAGRGYVRVQQSIGGAWFALSAQQRNLLIEPIGQTASQLWRVMSSNIGSGYWLESAVTPGYVLSGASTGSVSLLPINGSYTQLWYPQPVVIGPGFEPLWKTVSHDVRPNPPLAPAQIDIINSHKNALHILIGDKRTSRPQKISIPPGSKVTVPFDRDAGATVVETYEIRGPSGVWDRQQFVTPIPPAPIYDLSVYEEFLQSIAIDRTGTSPNPIEDVNYQPKSVGWLPLPPGRALPDFGQIDAFNDAKAAGNPGAVRRFDPKSLEKPAQGQDPLESILQSVSPPRQKF